MSGRRRATGLTDKEAARELMIAGYLFALDDVAKALAIPSNAGFLERLRGKAAAILCTAALDKAVSGSAS